MNLAADPLIHLTIVIVTHQFAVELPSFISTSGVWSAYHDQRTVLLFLFSDPCSAFNSTCAIIQFRISSSPSSASEEYQQDTLSRLLCHR